MGVHITPSSIFFFHFPKKSSDVMGNHDMHENCHKKFSLIGIQAPIHTGAKCCSDVIFRLYAIFEHRTSVCGCLYARQPKLLVAVFMYHGPLKYLTTRLKILDLRLNAFFLCELKIHLDCTPFLASNNFRSHEQEDAEREPKDVPTEKIDFQPLTES